MQKIKNTILIAGHYGFGNTGDEAILDSILAELRNNQPDLEIWVTSSNPHVTAVNHHVRSISWKDIPGLLEVALQSDLIMIGGGGVFVDYWGVPKDSQLTSGHWGITYYNAVAMLALIFNKPFVIHSVGVGPLATEDGKKLTRLTFDLADIATVRDQASKDLLVSLGVSSADIRITPDPGLYLHSNRDFVFEIFRTVGIPSGEKPILGVCVREWQGVNWKPVLASALDRFLEIEDVNILFIPFQKETDILENDVRAAESVLSLMKHQQHAYVLKEIHPPETTKGLLSCCKVVLGMRLHSLIFAAGVQVPTIAISYDPKVAGFMSFIGLNDFVIPLNDFEELRLIENLKQVWSNADLIASKLSKIIPFGKLQFEEFSRIILDTAGREPERSNHPLAFETLRILAFRQALLLAQKERELHSQWGFKLRSLLNGRPFFISNRFHKIRERLSGSGGIGEKIFQKLPVKLQSFRKSVHFAVRKKGYIGFLVHTIVDFTEKIKRIATKKIFSKQHSLMMQQLEANIMQHDGFIDYLPAPWGWNTKWFQRFQQISLASAGMGGLAFYGGLPLLDKDLYVYKQPFKNLFVFDGTDKKISHRLRQILSNSTLPRIMRIESVDLVTPLSDIENALKVGFKVVYEYIDEFSPEIVGAIPEKVYHRHEMLLKNEDVIVVTTSDRLFEKASSYRSKNIVLSTNGVDVDHWRKVQVVPPVDLIPLLDGDPIVAYHGTLASWVDYELLRMIADENRFNLLLIGHEHDVSFSKSGLKYHPRVHFLGGKSYFELNQYAAYYNVAILPFHKTYMTQSVSPVKIFEYMAARKPIVTTDLHECRKYRSCLVAKDKAEFIKLLYFSLQKASDPEYLELLDAEANENSWEEKTKEILRLAGIQI